MWQLTKALVETELVKLGFLAQKSVLLKASSGERCTPRNFAHFVALRGTRVRLIMFFVVHQIKCYGQMKQCNNILQFPLVRAERLSEKRKPRLCFPR